MKPPPILGRSADAIRIGAGAGAADLIGMNNDRRGDEVGFIRGGLREIQN